MSEKRRYTSGVLVLLDGRSKFGRIQIDNGRTVRFSADSECLKTLSKSFGKRIDAWIVKGDLKWWGEVKTFPGGPLKDLQLAKPIPKVSI